MMHRLVFALMTAGLVAGCTNTGHRAPGAAASADMTARERAQAELNQMYYAEMPRTATGCPPRASVMYRGSRYCVGRYQ
ncbi:hypothetical protein M8756_14945 [Lutimaribacter sp. EGI FJ00015]|uniref:Uncharacterized protein n=1 Tax=Lutimaribacter degradans TaxID=2945989 RepID=A0ACC6A036_9RHOB|nr:hypothetical protein [Lutimaribacter sp. EGI FJ00013]MCM2563435.1 hypothetical protein [Lutimaribacter sp. EGI FJ00013]MCO0614615.1 hypothetical protein [Lutimaribacter sp. EGI FJ00015]MCO0637286.1 hypothetical protein [Lutimaribacter sp. EGI FJ00014]